MYDVNVRTIKVTDYIGGPTAVEMLTLESQRQRNRVLADLAEKIAQFKRECKEEQAKAYPNKNYIEARMKKIALMQNTLQSCR